MRPTIAAALLALLAGCATGYGPQSLMGGFSETRLSPNVWRVNFAGNGYTSNERAADFSLLRAAELALENGFPYFVVVDSESDASAYTFTTPQTSTTNVQGTITPTYGSAAIISATGTTTTYGGQTFTYYKPRTGLVVVGVHEMQPNALTLDARFIAESLRQKYKLAP